MGRLRKDTFYKEFRGSIERLKVSHQKIIHSIEGIEQVLQKGNLTKVLYIKVKPEVLVFQDVILSHCEQQNFQFFRKLELYFQDKPQDLKMIEFLKKDLNALKVQILTFIEYHPCNMGDLNFHNFPKDFTSLAQNLITRIKIEKDYFLLFMES